MFPYFVRTSRRVLIPYRVPRFTRGIYRIYRLLMRVYCFTRLRKGFFLPLPTHVPIRYRHRNKILGIYFTILIRPTPSRYTRVINSGTCVAARLFLTVLPTIRRNKTGIVVCALYREIPYHRVKSTADLAPHRRLITLIILRAITTIQCIR